MKIFLAGATGAIGVRRYGHLHGPGSGTEARGEPPSLHVDAEAAAAILALQKGRGGIYNIAEPNSYISTDKARRELGFDANYRLGIAVPPARAERVMSSVIHARVSCACGARNLFTSGG